VQADLQLGTKIPMFGWMPLLLIPAGLILSIMGIAVFLLRRRSLRQAFSPEK
jgi:hypothetical protein